MPIANWLGRSLSIGWTMRGENWPIASWTTTIVMVNTSAPRLTIEVAIAPRIARAASGPPSWIEVPKVWPESPSIQSVRNDSSTPAPTQTTGMNHKLPCT